MENTGNSSAKYQDPHVLLVCEQHWIAGMTRAVALDLHADGQRQKNRTSRFGNSFYYAREVPELNKPTIGQRIMSRQASIKIIKRKEREQSDVVAEKSEAPASTPHATGREMVETVTNWVAEFKQRRRSETAQALKNLFPDPPRPREA